MEEDLHLVWFPSTVKREIYVSLFFSSLFGRVSFLFIYLEKKRMSIKRHVFGAAQQIQKKKKSRLTE